MKNFNMILIDKLQKISALSSGKINKYEDLTGEEIVPSNQKQQSRTSYIHFFSFGTSLWKTNKNNWGSRRKTSRNN